MTYKFVPTTEMKKRLDDLADKECTCDKEQEEGRKFPPCKRCQAASAINAIAEEIQNQYYSIFEE